MAGAKRASKEWLEGTSSGAPLVCDPAYAHDQECPELEKGPHVGRISAEKSPCYMRGAASIRRVSWAALVCPMKKLLVLYMRVST
jgi:hypothetical protein